MMRFTVKGRELLLFSIVVMKIVMHKYNILSVMTNPDIDIIIYII